ncbi:hypothetical protein SAMN06265349_106217 [Flavobacterium resistens]|uniref:Uncharacterized protein n=1 Tax=Flavobacterium resistens TaxID=443612 RepID=A0A521F3B3_9FLAO|nr:hypothetical protein [Flavobacterium resistens]MRX69514.1 hypothetical protein [Flavobacterium resistens]SMO90682.1 hypothetical protein SAMN06265349_106217 [Flavobacterium resistens]
MEKYHNPDYNQHDPDFIEQNIIVNGSFNEDEFREDLKNQEHHEFGESDPDYIDQNTLVDNDNYARNENPYQYQDEFIDDLRHLSPDFESHSIRAENIPNQDRVVNEDDAITNDERRNDFEPDSDYESNTDFENDHDLDHDDTEDLNDFDAEHYPENHPRA